MNTIQYALKGGGWVGFVDPETVTNKERKEIMRSLSTMDAVDAYDKVDIAVMTLLKGWSFELTLPTIQDNTLDGLPARVCDELYAIATKVMETLTPDYDPNPSPLSPTGPSSV